MARIKIDYGIDLGTTNSSICRMEKGKPIVIKTDHQKDIASSCVSFNRRGGIKVGDAAYRALKSDKLRSTKSWGMEASNTFIEFKRTMGTDLRYTCPNIGRDLSSEELSAEILKTLKSFVTDEVFHSVVITVPAKFTAVQKKATMDAAKMAGFEHCELLQEPIAASFAYGLSSEQKNGIWMVYDFGGGTFDVALLRVEDGVMQVFDTAGDNYLGGKDLDSAIVDKIIIPHLRDNYSIENILTDSQKNIVFREAMKVYAEETKIQLSTKESDDVLSDLGDLCKDEDGVEIELNLMITQQQAFDAMRPIFQKSVDICKNLLQQNNLKGSDINKLILVGGPTHSPLIRQMLREQITENVDTSIDPMTAVATGAALYAATRDAEVKDSDIEVGTIKLNVGYESMYVGQSEWVSVILDKSGSGASCPDKVYVEFLRSDNAWSSGKTEVDEKGTVIEANLLEGKSNAFSIICYNDKGDRMQCFPSEITIIEGSKPSSAPLPYNIGIATRDNRKERIVFTAAVGLEKNKPIPAIGTINGLSTSKQLRPGVSADTLTVPIYQCEDTPEVGRSASLYEYIADVVVTGDEIESLIPEDSPVDITLKVDKSEQMTLDIYFPSIDFTISKELNIKTQSIKDAEKQIPQMILEAKYEIKKLEDDGIDVSVLKSELLDVENENKNSQEKKAVLQHLKEVLRKIEVKDDSTEWQRLEKELREEFERLEKADDDLGNEKSHAAVSQLRTQIDQVIRSKNISAGHDLLEQIHALFFALTMVYQCIGLIKECNENFGRFHWKDASRARQLINQGLSLMANPKTEQLQPIAAQLVELMDDDDRSDIPSSGILRIG